jgi:hypothetical protein
MADQKPAPEPQPDHPVPPPKPIAAWDNLLKKGGEDIHHETKDVKRGNE